MAPRRDRTARKGTGLETVWLAWKYHALHLNARRLTIGHGKSQQIGCQRFCCQRFCWSAVRVPEHVRARTPWGAYCPREKPWSRVELPLEQHRAGGIGGSHGEYDKPVQEVGGDLWQDPAKPVDPVVEQSPGTWACGDGACPFPGCGREPDRDSRPCAATARCRRWWSATSRPWRVDEAGHWLGVMASQAFAPPGAAGATLPAERATGTKEGER